MRPLPFAASWHFLNIKHAARVDSPPTEARPAASYANLRACFSPSLPQPLYRTRNVFCQRTPEERRPHGHLQEAGAQRSPGTDPEA